MNPNRIGKQLINLVITGFLITSACSLFQTIGDNGTAEAGKILQTQTISLGGAGGSFQVGDLEIGIGTSNIQNQVEVTLTEIEIPSGSGVESQSSLFGVEGIPLGFNGNLQARITLPEKLLKGLNLSDPGAAEKLSFYFGTYGYAPSAGGFSFGMFPVDAHVDLAAGVADLQVQVSESFSMAVSKLAAPAQIDLGQFSAQLLTEHNFYFLIRNDGGRQIATSEHFKVYYPTSISSTMISPLIDDLELARADIKALGFPWRSEEDNLKFPVYIEDCDALEYIYWGAATSECYGRFDYSTIYGFHMILHPRTLNSDLQTLKATVGHELMHYAQTITHLNDLGYTLSSMARTDGVYAWTMLDEATAIWYEKRITGDPNWLPDVAVLEAEFYRKPWYFETDKIETQSAGYGASWFVRYLADTIGEGFILQAYLGTGASSGKDALAASIFTSAGTTPQTQFTKFLPAYFLDPAGIAQGLPTTTEFKGIYLQNLFLEATGDQLDFKETMISQNGRSGVVLSAMPGKILESGEIDQPAVASISTSLPGSMTAYFFRMTLPEQISPWQEKALISVEVYSDAGSGAMVYGVPAGLLSAATPLAGPDNYLSSEGSNFNLFIPASEGFSELAFILFNNTPPSDATSSQVNVTISYGPARAMTLYGSVTKDSPRYPENICELPSGCYPYTNPPACVETGGGGGGGGGEGGGQPWNPVPCPSMPDWCYWCSEYNHASNLVTYGYYGNWDYVEIYLDEKGNVSDIQFLAHGDELVSGPDIRMTGGTSFEATWVFIDNLSKKPYTTWKMWGQASPSGGSGNWQVSYEIPGVIWTGSWTASPR